MAPGNAHLGNEDHGGYGRILGVPPPAFWTEAARRVDTIHMEQAFDPKFPEAYTEYEWDPTTGILLHKQVYADSTKFTHVFTVDFEWGPTGLLVEKTVQRHEDGAILTVYFTWDSNEVLQSKRLELIQADFYPDGHG